MRRKKARFSETKKNKRPKPMEALRKVGEFIKAQEERIETLRLEVARKKEYLGNNSSSNSQEEAFEVDDDSFRALEAEQNGDLESAKGFHLAAYEKLIAIEPPTEPSARGIAAFASFAVRNASEDATACVFDEDQVMEAFDYIAELPAVANTVECERAVFLGFTIGDSARAWEAFKHARELFPGDVQLLCNYARFVDSVLVQEAEEDGDMACVPELKDLAAELYSDALELSPQLANALVNLSAILVEQSRDKSFAERRILLERARDLLLRALEQDGGEDNSMAMLYYNLACIECLLVGKANVNCAKHLERAVKLDPSLRNAIVQDPDLNSVRKEKWCLALLK